MLFGDAVTITADGPWQHLLYQLTGRKWGNLDVENETGCGIVPYVYKDRNLVNAVQWAVGLELLLLIKDPWRVFLTTDHPNGGCFWRYPEIIQLLMDADFRKEQIGKLPAKAQQRIMLPISIASTRSPKSRSSRRRVRRVRWACRRRAISASAPTRTSPFITRSRTTAVDVRVSAVRDQGRRDRGRRRGRHGSRRRPGIHREAGVRRAIEEYLRPLFQRSYTMSFENYPVEMDPLAPRADPAAHD